jgi:hypothetical protein
MAFQVIHYPFQTTKKLDIKTSDASMWGTSLASEWSFKSWRLAWPGRGDGLKETEQITKSLWDINMKPNEVESANTKSSTQITD